MDEADWNNVKSDIAFEEYMSCYANVMISKLCTVDELVENRLPDAHLSSEEEEKVKKLPHLLDTLGTFSHNASEKPYQELTTRRFCLSLKVSWHVRW